jgi:tetratricopeptide (TPR) repeat protein
VTQAQHAAGSGDYSKAEQIFLKAVHEAERFGADDARVGSTLESLGQVYNAERKFTDAESAYRRAMGILAKVNGDDSADAANLDFDMARSLYDAGRPAEAVSWARKTVSSYEILFGGNNPHTVTAVCLLGDSLRLMRNFIDAEAPLRRCADTREADGGIDNIDLADALHSLALTYAAERKYELAEPRFKLAEKIRENKLGLTSPLLAQTLEDHAAMLRSMGRDKEAARLTTLAAAIRRTERKNAH